MLAVALVPKAVEDGERNEAHGADDRGILGHEAPPRPQVHLRSRGGRGLPVQDVRVDEATPSEGASRGARVALVPEEVVALARVHPAATALRATVPGEVGRAGLVVGIPVPYQVRDDGPRGACAPLEGAAGDGLGVAALEARRSGPGVVVVGLGSRGASRRVLEASVANRLTTTPSRPRGLGRRRHDEQADRELLDGARASVLPIAAPEAPVGRARLPSRAVLALGARQGAANAQAAAGRDAVAPANSAPVDAPNEGLGPAPRVGAD